MTALDLVAARGGGAGMEGDAEAHGKLAGQVGGIEGREASLPGERVAWILKEDADLRKGDERVDAEVFVRPGVEVVQRRRAGSGERRQMPALLVHAGGADFGGGEADQGNAGDEQSGFGVELLARHSRNGHRAGARKNARAREGRRVR